MVTETFLDEHDSDTVIAVDGFTVYRHDRFYTTPGGGVALYFKSLYTTSVLFAFPRPFSNFPEYFGVSVSSTGCKILILVVYRRSHAPNNAFVFTAIAQYLSNYSLAIIVGDSNIAMNR